MPRAQTSSVSGVLLDLSAAAPGPLHLRLASSLRTAIRSGRLPSGAALPASRVLAADLAVSRWTVTQAYSQLATEGYVAGRAGSATRVCWSPDPGDGPVVHQARPDGPPRYDLSQCASDLRAFPRTRWLHALRSAADSAPFDRLGYPPPGGEPRLREVLAAALNRRRAARARTSTTCIFPGARAAMAELAHALVAAGHTHVGVENPGSSAVWQAAVSAGLRLVPIPVDPDGLVTAQLESHPQVRAVCVTPAHHVATGCALAPDRRAALLTWARRTGGLIIEDDYDSEFSYGRPASATIQGSDPEHVALLGSMSRTMTPTVNVGWVVVPRRLAASVQRASPQPSGPPALTQLALADFLESGAYDRHLRASQQRFRRRRNALVTALRSELPNCRIHGAEAGLHFVVELPEGASPTHVRAAAQRRNMKLCDIADTRFEPDPHERLLQVGFANLADAAVDEAASILADLIKRSALPDPPMPRTASAP